MKPKLLGSIGAVIGAALVIFAIFLGFKLHHGRNITWAAGMGDLNLLQNLERKGESLNYQDPHAFNSTPLMEAIYFQRTNVTQYLLTRNVNLNLQDRHGWTALMMAVMAADTNTVRLLLEKGADTTIKDSGGADVFSYMKGKAHRGLFTNWLNQDKDKNRPGAKP